MINSHPYHTRRIANKAIYRRLAYCVAVAMLAANMAVPCSADEHLVGYWPFDGNLDDMSGNGNHGQPFNLPVSFVGGMVGDAVSFTGADGEGVLVPDADVLDLKTETGGMAISAWINMDNLDTFYFIASKQNSGTAGVNWPGNFEFRTKPNAGDLEYLFQLDGTESGNFRSSDAGVITADNWHHVGVSIDVEEDLISFYVDGEPAGEQVPAGVFGTDESLNDEPIRIGFRKDGFSTFNGKIDDLAIWNTPIDGEKFAAIADGEPCCVPPPPFNISGNGETYSQNFDDMGTKKTLPTGWKGDIGEGLNRRVSSLGLQDGGLGVAGNPVDGLVNVGGNADNFTSTDAGQFLATWKSDLDGNTLFNDDDIIADGATDRALGQARASEDVPGLIDFQIEIVDGPLRAFVFDWDMEVWGGDPEQEFRGSEGAGVNLTVSVGDNSYYEASEVLKPGDLFDTTFDFANVQSDTTLIDGNIHAVRGNSSELVEIAGGDGAVGNIVHAVFDADYGDADTGWITAVDNVQLRAVAPGDVDANGSVDPLDIVELLKGGQFGTGVNGVTWQQGDFNGDDKFDPLDLVAVLTALNGEFPKTYASEQGVPGDDNVDVIVDFTSGEVVVDFAGHTASSVIIDSAAGIFNGDAPAWDTMGEFRTASAAQLSNTMFNGTESGVDNLGNLIKAEFMDVGFDFNADLTVKLLVATPDGPVTVDGHVIVIPEPSTWVLFGFGSLALLAVTRRRITAC